jgi:hypothetical protein
MQRRNDALEDEAVGLRHRILSKVPIRPHRMSGAPMARAGTVALSQPALPVLCDRPAASRHLGPKLAFTLPIGHAE